MGRPWRPAESHSPFHCLQSGHPNFRSRRLAILALQGSFWGGEHPFTSAPTEVTFITLLGGRPAPPSDNVGNSHTQLIGNKYIFGI